VSSLKRTTTEQLKINLNISCSWRINFRVNRWKAMIALLLAMLYLPATAHCLLEQAAWLPAGGGCCEESPTADSSETSSCPDGCCPLEDTGYPRAFGGSSTAFLASIQLYELAALVDFTPKQALAVLPQPSPPDLPKAWQFAFRAALPPRAPSFVS